MRCFLLLSSFLLSFSILKADDYKNTISRYQEQIATASPDQVSLLKKDLAILFYNDQDQEKSFQTFLEALDLAQTKAQPTVSEEENALYEQALQSYLNHSDKSIQENAQDIYAQYQPVLKEHPDYLLLKLLVSSTYANLEMMDEFFETFYQSYIYFPNHFLSYKAKANLHAKLFARGRTPVERDLQRGEVITNLAKAIQFYPQDTSLYKMIILTAKKENKTEMVRTYLIKIINDNIVIPRSDIAFYVEHAIRTDQTELAQDFIEKAKEWYPYSRTINVAEKLLSN